MTSAPRWLAITLTLAAGVGIGLFAWAEVASDGWTGLQRYGRAPGGLSWAQLLPPQEGRFLASSLLLLPALLAAAAWATRGDLAERLLTALGRHHRWVAAAAAAVACAGSLATSHLVLDRTPITDDEEAYRFHARVLASGALTAPSPPDAAFYDNVFLINDGRWFSQYPVGNPALLAPGVWAGDPWLVPALLAGLLTLLLAASGRELFGPTAGAVTALMVATSPFLLAMSGTLLAHTPCLFALALGWWCGLRATRPSARGATGPRGAWAWAAVAALAWGLAVLIRPSSAVLVAAPLAAVLAWRWWAAGRPWDALVAFGAAALVVAGVQGGINQICNGDPLRSAYTHYWAESGWSNPFGFGDFPWKITHTPARGLANAWHALVRLDAWLLGWPLALGLPLAAPWLVRQRRPVVLALLASGLGSFAVYFFFFWPGVADVGPVLYFETALAWWLLAGAAVACAAPPWRRALVGVVVAGVLVAPLAFHRVQARALSGTAEEVTRAQAQVEEALAGQRALVFCDEYLRPADPGSWVAARPNPWPDLRDPILYVRDLGPDANRDFARQQHPDRRAYRLRWIRGWDFALDELPGGTAEP